ncbi:hypothetical protein XELAEV_18038730mg [Xenopus laevis]|uniref:Uncharacterized protein n=1 Tax=Xenopus laevis TaxID=8355 RepID=A0A974C6I0_XENLA|nr:hypothetical protein XELAEV_18038730mg [Xenopus laevis]
MFGYIIDLHHFLLFGRLEKVKKGCSALTILRRYPTTDQHGGFDLLRFRPGSVHPSLDNLAIPSSPRNTILILNLVWTPDQHGSGQTRTPGLK